MNFRGFLSAILLMCFLTAADNALAELQMDCRLGFDSYYKKGSYTPLYVDLSVDQADFSGYIQFSTSSNNYRSNYTYRKDVSLTAPSKQRYLLYIKTAAMQIDPRVILYDNGGKQVNEVLLNVRPVGPLDDFILVVNSSPSAMTYMNGRRNGTGNNQYYAAPIEVKDIPDSWQGLAGVSYIVFGDARVGQLTAKQYKALEQWCLTGGHIVFAPGAASDLYRDTLLSELMPGKVAGTTSKSTWTELGQFIYNPPPPNERSILCNFIPLDSEVLARKNDIPLIATKKKGLGRCTLIAMDINQSPLRGWKDSDGFWSEVFTLGKTYKSIGKIDGLYDNPNLDEINKFLADIPNLAIPGINKIGLFLVLYILLVGPINYIALRKLKHLEWAWFTIPIIVIVFTGVAYGMAKATKGSQLISKQAAYIYAGESSGWGLEKSYSGLFSPTKTAYDISSWNEDGIVESISDKRFDAVNINYKFEERMIIKDIPIRMWEMARFSTCAPVKLEKGIKASLNYSQDGTLKGTITNGTPYNFTEAWLVSSQAKEGIKDLGSGEDWKINTLVNNFTVPFESQLFALTLKGILFDANLDYNFIESGGYIFIGRIQDSISNLKVAGYIPIDQGEIYIIVPVSTEINGDQGIIPSSMIKRDILSHTDYSIPAQSGITSKLRHFIGQGSNIIEYKLPLDGERYKLQEIEYSYNFSNNPLKDMEIFNWYSGNWEKLANYGKSSADNLKIKDADRFLRPTDSRIRFRVEFNQSSGKLPVILEKFDITPSYTGRNA